MVKESISKMKNGKAAKQSGMVSEMVKLAGEAKVDVVTNQINQISVGVIPSE